MKNLIVLLTVVLLTACVSTQEVTDAKDVTVVQKIDPYIPVSHPELPNPIKARDVKVRVLTSSVELTELIKNINNDKELSTVDKEIIIEQAEFVFALKESYGNDLFYALDEESAKNLSVYFNDVKTYINGTRSVLQHYRKDNLYKRDEAYSLEE